MRPGQNKRMRSRNNRKGPNPLTRTYESNGPDVKIRGTAQHVAEKYLQLARDANSSGDPVMAESYLQHAEHYFRLIAAAQQANQQQMGYARSSGDPGSSEPDDNGYDDDSGMMNDRFAAPAERAQQLLNQPQPSLPPQANLFAEPPRDDATREDTDDSDAPSRPIRNGADRRPMIRRPRTPPRQNERRANGDDAAIPSVDEGLHPLPTFITGGPGRAHAEPDPDGTADDGVDGGAQDRQGLRPRRRRRQKVVQPGGGSEPDIASGANGLPAVE